MMEYAGKILCERCKKPIGEMIMEDRSVKRKPYLSYRKFGDYEVCNICLHDMRQEEHRQAWRREQGII